jgi:hypothetical protein
MGQIIDPYSIKIWIVFSMFIDIDCLLGYLDRYRNMKILQLQTSGDEFFLPDNEVK